MNPWLILLVGAVGYVLVSLLLAPLLAPVFSRRVRSTDQGEGPR